MSTFVMRDEYLVSGEEYDKAQGFKESVEADGEEFEPYMVEFIRAWEDTTWDTDIVHVPLPMTHEKCTDDDLVRWYTAVHGGRLRKAVYFGVFSRSPY